MDHERVVEICDTIVNAGLQEVNALYKPLVNANKFDILPERFDDAVYDVCGCHSSTCFPHGVPSLVIFIILIIP
jgi:hypothetical protein